MEKTGHEEEKLLKKESWWSGTMFVICMVAIAQGVLGLADLSMSYLYKDDFGMSPAQVSIANSVTSLPWIIKPVWGFISDCFPIAGKRRGPYLAIFGLVAVGAWVSMSMLVNSAIAAVIVMLVIQISNAFCNVIGEALVVEESQKSGHNTDQASQNVSLFFGLRAVGIILTAYTGGLLLEVLTNRTVFLITASFPLILCCASAFCEEQRVVTKPEIKSQLKDIWGFIKQPGIAYPIVFIFLFMATPSSSDAMFYYYTNELNFHPEFMGRMKMIHGIASLLGIILYNKYLKAISFKKMLIWSSIICSVMGCTQILLVTRVNTYLDIPDSIFCLCSGFLVQALAEINSMPLLVLCCQLCPKNIEGSLYALLMSTMNFGGLISFQLGGLIMICLGINQHNFDLLWLMLLITNLMMLLPLPLLKLVPDVNKKEEENGYDTV